MEGLLIAALRAQLDPLLPSGPTWCSFPGPRVICLHLSGAPDLIIDLDPKAPHLRPGTAPGPARTPFQQMLEARLRGPLVATAQPQLDRVLILRFDAGQGFVSSPPVELVLELVGQRANALVLDQAGVVRGALRQTSSARLGAPYAPLPAQDKADPRAQDVDRIAQKLLATGLPPERSIVQALDGFGLILASAACRLAQVSGQELTPESARQLAEAVQAIAHKPQLALESGVDDILEALERHYAQVAEQARLAELRHQVRRGLEQEIKLLHAKLADCQRTRSSAAEAATYQRYGDLLLACAHLYQPGTTSLT
ncbi:MAG: NFACT family protein, partial [Deinococcus sp.]|nr:NFACT family protein [Deinococcus sp.]